MLRHLSNNAPALLAQDLGARGDGVTFAGATAGAMAIAAATAALAEGAIDAALVVAYDSLLEPEQLIALAACGALSSGTVHELAAPYAEPSADSVRGGIPGEAAAALLLEREDQQDRALAFVEATDGADGEKGLPAMSTVAAVAARIADADLVIDGCALADPQRDQKERQQLSLVVDPAAQLLAIQAATGFLGAATSVVQTIVLGSLLRAARLPPIPGLHHAAPGPLTPLAGSVSTDARSALGVCLGAPGLAAAVRVSLPPTIGTDLDSVPRSSRS
jgi:3-oxoacyl-(acyl-carrier-protein) synthase